MKEDIKHLKKIKSDVDEIKKRLVVKTPTHFSFQHMTISLFGALVLGQTFVLKGLLYEVSESLTFHHAIAIILITFFVLSLEIYFIGYKRVLIKKKRHFGQFWLKRIITYSIIAFCVSFGLIFLYNMSNSAEFAFRIAVVMFFPCAVGASLADLVERY